MSRSIVVFIAFALLALSTAFATTPTTPPASAPAVAPTAAPTAAPTGAPTGAPATAPADVPAAAPSAAPATAPATTPSAAPSAAPSGAPAASPSGAPATAPAGTPAVAPSGAPAGAPTNAPGAAPSGAPGAAPAAVPGSAPGAAPGAAPSAAPSAPPTAPPAPTGPVRKQLNLRIVNTIFSSQSNSTCTFFAAYNNDTDSSKFIQLTAPRLVNQVAQPFYVPIFKINDAWTPLSILGQCNNGAFNTVSYPITTTDADPAEQDLTLYFFSNVTYPQIATQTSDTGVQPALPPPSAYSGVVGFAFAGFVGGYTNTPSVTLNVTVGNVTQTLQLNGNIADYIKFNLTGSANATIVWITQGTKSEEIILTVQDGDAYTIGIVPASNITQDVPPVLAVFKDIGIWAQTPATSGWTIVHAISDGTQISVSAVIEHPDNGVNSTTQLLSFTDNVKQFLTNRGDIVNVTITVTSADGKNVTVLNNPWALFTQLYAQLPYNNFLYSSRNASFVFYGASYAEWAQSQSVKFIASDYDAYEAAAQGIAMVRFTNFLAGPSAQKLTYKLRQTVPTPPSAPPVAPPAAPPAVAPSAVPGAAPSAVPGAAPSGAPGAAPSAVPGSAPSAAPAGAPTNAPAAAPGAVPGAAPSAAPTGAPTAAPTSAPAAAPAAAPASAPAAAPTASPVAPPSVPTAPAVAPAAAPAKAVVREMYIAAEPTYLYTNYTVDPGDWRQEVALDLSSTYDLFIEGLPATTGDVQQPDFGASLAVGRVIAVYATGDANQTGPYGPKVTWTDEQPTNPPPPSPEKESIWKKPWIYIIIGGVALVLLGAIAFCIKKKRSQDENKPLLP